MDYNTYRWHPKGKRVSQCVHQAADNLKSSGAQDYFMIGTRAQIPLTDFTPLSGTLKVVVP